ncbi:hypothetical protein BJ912DRAFT_366581 [Pholiota molesta]|nr:hypothetical protein BJ912DRAFT_366581 [Pholiota molesta]
MDDSHQRFSRTKTRTHEQSKKKNKSTRRAKETCNDGNPLWTNVCAVQRGMRINTLAPPQPRIRIALVLVRTSHCQPPRTAQPMVGRHIAKMVGRHIAKRIRTISLRWAATHFSAGHWPGTRSVVHAVLPCYTKYHGFAPELVCPSPKPAGPVELKVRRMSIQHVQASYTAISTSSAASIAEEWTHSHPNGTRGRRPSWSSTRSELALQEHKT